jgi:transcriptional regulator with XRE-family HTH domain
MRNARIPNIQLREHREQHHLTQAALAEQLGVSTLTVGRWERGEAVPTPYALRKLCMLLEATPQDLGFSEDEEEEREQNEERDTAKAVPLQESAQRVHVWALPRLSRRAALISIAAGAVVVAGGGLLLLHQVEAPSHAPVLPPTHPQTLKPSLTYNAHVKRVESVSWHPSDAYVASASADGIVRVWRSDHGDDLLSSQCALGVIYTISWSPDGRWLVLAGDDRAAWVIPAFPSTPSHSSNLPRSLSWTQGHHQ